MAIPVLLLLTIAWRRGNAGRPTIPLPGMAWILPVTGHGSLPGRIVLLVRAAGLCGLILTAAGPEDAAAARNRVRPSAALVMVLDISSSMTSSDFAPLNRLEAARTSLRRLVDRLAQVDLGLVAVAGAPAVYAPVTGDHAFILRALDGLRSAEFGEDGTALGTGLASAANRLRYGAWACRRILLVTDGVSNRGAISPSDGAELCKALGIRIDVIGLGTDIVSRFLVPIAEGQEQEVQARIDIDDLALERMARGTGGGYRRARNSVELDQALNAVLADLGAASRDTGARWTRLVAPAVLLLLAIELLLVQFGFCELPQ